MCARMPLLIGISLTRTLFLDRCFSVVMHIAYKALQNQIVQCAPQNDYREKHRLGRRVSKYEPTPHHTYCRRAGLMRIHHVISVKRFRVHSLSNKLLPLRLRRMCMLPHFKHIMPIVVDYCLLVMISMLRTFQLGSRASCKRPMATLTKRLGRTSSHLMYIALRH